MFTPPQRRPCPLTPGFLLNNILRSFIRLGLTMIVGLVSGAAFSAPQLALGQSVVATIPVGSSPYDLGVNPITNRIYVANNDSADVSVIDGSTDATLTTINIGQSGPFGVDVNPVTNRAYVSALGSNTVTVIDGSTNTVVTTVGGFNGPTGVAVNPTTNRIYVSNFSGSSVAVMDGVTNTVLTTISTPPNPNGVDVNPATNKVYASSNVTNSLYVMDGATNTFTTSVTVGASPFHTTVNPATNKIYTANQNGNTLSVVDGSTNTVTATISVFSSPYPLDANTARNRIYVGNFDGNSVTILDGATNAIVATVPGIPSPVFGVGVNEATNKIYVSNKDNDTVTVISDPVPLIISEFRNRGPNDSTDEFIELYNNSNSPITPGGTGFAVVAEDGMVRCVVPAATVIPARGHFLCSGSGYSLSAYATSDAPITSDIGDQQGIALFNTTLPAGFIQANRLDAFGYSSSPPLYREGGGFPFVLTYNIEQSILRTQYNGPSKDTGDNATDFIAVNARPDIFDYGFALGAPGPENLASPIQRNAQIPVALLDTTRGPAEVPNRERSAAAVPNGQFGTMTFRRTFTNNTTQNVTRLRIRVIDITTLNSKLTVTPGQAAPCNSTPCADLRAISSPDEAAIGTGAGPVSTNGTLLEEPPGQPLGGGYNSSLGVRNIDLAQPLLPGGKVNVNIRVGVQRNGAFRFYINVEALP